VATSLAPQKSQFSGQLLALINQLFDKNQKFHHAAQPKFDNISKT